MFTSCQKDDEHHRDTVTLKAIIADTPNTSGNSKVYIDTVTENSVMTYYSAWHNGDKVNINGAEYELEVAAGNRGNALAATISGVEAGPTNSFVAAYPSTSTVEEGNLSPTVSVADTQVYKLTSVHNSGSVKQEIASPMVGYCPAGSDTIKFHNAAGIIKVTVSNTTGAAFKVHYITVTADGQYLAGSGAVSGLGTSVPVMAKPASGSKTITLDCCGEHPEIANNGSAIFYVVTAPFSDQTLTFNVMAEDESKTKYTFTATTNRPLSLENNKLGSVTVSITDGTTHTSALFWGEGTKKCPYLITNLDDLKLMRDIVNYTSPYDNSSYQTAYNTNTRYYRQTDDITLDSWESAIGTKTYPFAGNYDGGGNDISGITSIGLFNYAGGGSIKYVTSKGTSDIFVTGSKPFYLPKSFGGIVDNVVDEEKIEYCNSRVAITIVKGSLTQYGTANKAGLGGIVGRADAKVTISHCNNQANIKHNPNQYGYYNVRIGGIIGYNNGVGSEISYCTNEKVIGSNNSSTYGYGAYGGICAYTRCNILIDHCCNRGTISSNYKSTAQNWLGGILGQIDSAATAKIEYCDNYGPIVAPNLENAAALAGILAGSNNASSSTEIQISNCNNYAHISCTTGVGNSITAGGICAYVTSGKGLKISNCNNGSIVGGVRTDSTITARYAGGICCSTSVSTTMTRVTNNMSISSAQYCGGITAIATGNSITSNYSVCTNNGDITATSYFVGGIMGSCTQKIGYFDTCYNSGVITGTSKIGGIIGNVGGTTKYIRKCLNDGVIMINGTIADQSVGGMIGYLDASTTYIYNCGNNKSITGTTNAIGGLVGYYRPANGTAYIKNSYSVGNITAGTQTGSPYQHGAGLVGCINKNSTKAVVKMENCYYSGVVVGGFKGTLATKFRNQSNNDATVTNCYALDTNYTGTGSVGTILLFNSDKTWKRGTGDYWSSDSTLLKALNKWATVHNNEGFIGWIENDGIITLNHIW